jgi:hypothetical protein
LSLFLVLSSPRKGRYSGKILVISERSDKPIRYVKFLATFQEDNEVLPLYVEVGDCVFPEAGLYSFEIYFSARDGGEALKGEHPFNVRSHEEWAMSKKASVLPRIAPLRRVIAEPITDPAEQAALDKLHKREKRKQGGQKAKINRNGAKPASSSAAKRRG